MRVLPICCIAALATLAIGTAQASAKPDIPQDATTVATPPVATSSVESTVNVTAANPESVKSALQDAGYKAELKKEEDGDPYIESRFSGVKTIIIFFGCSEGKNCTTVQFYSGFSEAKNAQDKMNEWNKTRRFTRAYIDKDGDPVLEMDIDLDTGGISQNLFKEYLSTWDGLVGQYYDLIFPEQK